MQRTLSVVPYRCQRVTWYMLHPEDSVVIVAPLDGKPKCWHYPAICRDRNNQFNPYIILIYKNSFHFSIIPIQAPYTRLVSVVLAPDAMNPVISTRLIFPQKRAHQFVHGVMVGESLRVFLQHLNVLQLVRVTSHLLGLKLRGSITLPLRSGWFRKLHMSLRLHVKFAPRKLN